MEKGKRRLNTLKKMKMTEDYKKLQEACGKITKILLNSKLINDFRDLSAELLSQGIRRDSSHTDYLWDIFKRIKVYPTKVLEDIEFDNEQSILSLSRLKKSSSRSRIVGPFCLWIQKLTGFCNSRIREEGFYRKNNRKSYCKE